MNPEKNIVTAIAELLAPRASRIQKPTSCTRKRTAKRDDEREHGAHARTRPRSPGRRAAPGEDEGADDERRDAPAQRLEGRAPELLGEPVALDVDGPVQVDDDVSGADALR